LFFSDVILYVYCRPLLCGRHILGAARTIVCGGVGGMSLWVVIFPFDVVKSRMQIHQTDLPMVTLLVKISR